MAASSGSPAGTLTLSATAQYIALLLLLAASVIASYVLKVFPTALGNLTGGISVVALFTYASHDLEQEGAPAGFPRYLSFIVLTVSAAAMGAIGSFTGQSVIEVGAFLTWVIAFLGLLYHAVAQDAGASIPVNAEVWFLSIVGVLLSVLTWYAGGAMDGVAGLVATLVAVVPTYFHVTAGSITPTPPANPVAAPA